jgi:hypothetical protein
MIRISHTSRDAGYDLREANRLLVLEAWDIIHRGSFGYPGWYDPNHGLYVGMLALA